MLHTGRFERGAELFLGISQDPGLFIVGPPRSGTTMVRLILNRHPYLAVPPETWFFPKLMFRAGLYGDFSNEQQLECFAQDVASSHSEAARPAEEVLGLGPRQVKEAVRRARARSYGEAFAALMSALADREGKDRWGEKTPFYSAILPLLARTYPRAKFIAMVRDPRDVVGSIHRGGWRFYPTLIDAAMRWRYGMEGIERAMPVLGQERLFALSFEELVRRPEGSLERLCEFLDLPFVPSMLRFHEDADQQVPEQAKTWHQSLYRPIDPTYIGRWRSTFDERQAGLIEAACGASFERWGYEKEGQVSAWSAGSRIALWNLKRWRKIKSGRRHWSRMVRPMDV